MIEWLGTHTDVLIYLITSAVGFIVGYTKLQTRMKQIENRMDNHDRTDIETKRELIALIERNKNATDLAATSIEAKIDRMQESVTRLTTMNELWLQNKIKD